MADLSKRVRIEEADQFFAMEDAVAFVKKTAEDRKLADMLAASKKKKPTKGKAKEAEPDIPPPEKEEKKEVKEEGPPDYNNHNDVLRCLRREAPRAFTFGPIKFSNLDLPDTPEIQAARTSQIIDKLHEVSSLGEPRICIKGYKVRVKGRTLKRRGCYLKHSRFLKNLEVVPIVPEPVQTRSKVTLDEEGSNAEDSN